MCFEGNREAMNTTITCSVLTFNMKCVWGSQNGNTEEGKNVKRETEEDTQMFNKKK